MERIMSVEDKIRRAEEIYNRRRENEYRSTSTKVSIEKNNDNQNAKVNKKLKKMIIQIIVCLLIYLSFNNIINNNFFSEDFRKKCEEILYYDISFNQIYETVNAWINTIKETYPVILPEEEKKQDEKQNENQQITENSTTENIENTQEVVTEEQKEAYEIKSKINFIKPLIGTITSRYGPRNPEVSTVSKFHTGIDIAADQGTDIISATNGKVVFASSEGAYGNHLKIQIEDLIIIYAHCLALSVKEGDEIIQGQKIAQVGSTGNSTGPHLHFEIRKEDRYINPDLILEF